MTYSLLSITLAYQLPSPVHADPSVNKCLEDLNGPRPTFKINLDRVMPPLNDQGNNGTCYAQGAAMLLSAYMFEKSKGPQNPSDFDYSPEMTLLLLALKNPNYLQARLDQMAKDRTNEIFGYGWTEDVLKAINEYPEVLVPVPSDLYVSIIGPINQPIREVISTVIFEVNHASNSLTFEKAQKEIKLGVAKVLRQLNPKKAEHQKVLSNFAKAGFSLDGKSLKIIDTPAVSLGLQTKNYGSRNARLMTREKCQQILDGIFISLCHKRPVEVSLVPPNNPYGRHSIVVDGLNYINDVPHLYFRDSAGGQIRKISVIDLCGPSANPNIPTMLYGATAIVNGFDKKE